MIKPAVSCRGVPPSETCSFSPRQSGLSSTRALGGRPVARVVSPVCRPAFALCPRASLQRNARDASTRAASLAQVPTASNQGQDLDQTPGVGELETPRLQGQRKQERLARRQRRLREQAMYQLSAIAASSLLTSTAIVATWFRFTMHTLDNQFPTAEFGLTLLLVLGGMFGMEMYARYAHRILWHDFEPGWALHKSHHEPRTGPFEANDIYALANALPAMLLCAYGFITPGISGGICFGLGLGITLFGISYMFVHDGMVHRRFPVGPVAELPYLKRVAVAHQIHHSERFGGVPYGLFFGPQELEAVGGGEYLESLLANQQSKPKQ